MGIHGLWSWVDKFCEAYTAESYNDTSISNGPPLPVHAAPPAAAGAPVDDSGMGGASPGEIPVGGQPNRTGAHSTPPVSTNPPAVPPGLPSPTLRSAIQPSYLANLRIGIDANFFLCQVFYALKVQEEAGVILSLVKFVQRVDSKLREEHQVARAPWYFDGEAPRLRRKTLEQREKARKRSAEQAGLHQQHADAVKSQAEEVEVKVKDLEDKILQLETDIAIEMDDRVVQEAQAKLTDLHTQHRALKTDWTELQMDTNTAQHKSDRRDYASKKLSRGTLKALQKEMVALGIEAIQCEEEADYDLSEDAKAGWLDLVCTGDSDGLASGIPQLCRKLPFVWGGGEAGGSEDQNAPVWVYHAPQIWAAKGWTQAQWIDFCLLLGHDEDQMRLTGLGAVGAEVLLGEYKSIEGILEVHDTLVESQRSREARVAELQAQLRAELDRGLELKDGEEGVPEMPAPPPPVKRRRKAPGVDKHTQKLQMNIQKIQGVPEGYGEYLSAMRELFGGGGSPQNGGGGSERSANRNTPPLEMAQA